MPRRAPPINLKAEERSHLISVVSAHKSPARDVLRAQIILLCAQGFTNQAIATELSVNVLSVSKWRNRFVEKRLEGLYDLPRSGKPKRYKIDERHRILKLLETPPPQGQSTWDGGSIAQELGFSDDYVWRVLRKEGIQLQRKRSWCVSTDPEFATKSADIIGLYLNPPERAFVLCVDEKPNIQALSRQHGYVQTSSGKIVQGLQSTYKRNGTQN